MADTVVEVAAPPAPVLAAAVLVSVLLLLLLLPLLFAALVLLFGLVLAVALALVPVPLDVLAASVVVLAPLERAADEAPVAAFWVVPVEEEPSPEPAMVVRAPSSSRFDGGLSVVGVAQAIAKTQDASHWPERDLDSPSGPRRMRKIVLIVDPLNAALGDEYSKPLER